MKKQFINVVSVDKKWFNLEASTSVAKELLNYYSINTPVSILAPKNFPLVIKTINSSCVKVVYSMSDLINVVSNIAGEKYILEEYLEGTVYSVLTLWDKKNAIHYLGNQVLTEVQSDRMNLFQTKLNFLLSDEAPDFIGFFTTKLIWSNNDWYVLGFKMGFDEKSILNCLNADYLYVLNSAIYQKVNELR